MDLSSALLAGALAGLALAAPLGAIGVLLVQEGATRGLRRGFAAAAAVASVDVAYCSVAVVAGSVAGPLVASWAPWPQLVGGVTLLALGVRGVLAGRRPASGARVDASPRRFALFAALTAINPATLVYFAALLPGLEQIAPTAGARVAFVAGVGAASLGWQALLVALGAGVGRAAPAFRRWSTVIGGGLVAVLGAVLMIRAL
ncbi:LysE family transporter [Rathayibacter sp. VKM Ac-2754]|uniref:LysE family transporter n=1 Tax=Rathayibacter sp. VKM Ac-2754 TaxID=2609251 RepID=UPI00135BA6E0|nr:LysE family transporter [Rathayibacter sp. VKM Ac-2754]MWV58644.1 LysE family transporter [Rathayibacter sp. VKM Ac-2754]